MGMEFRSDRGTLRNFTRTASGGIRVEAAISKPGVYEYKTTDGKVSRELKGPDMVFDQKALERLRDAPVTIDHPAEFVTPDNWSEHSIGNVSGTPKRDGDLAIAEVVINDAGAIKKIAKDELREVSLGYYATIVEESGVFDGQEYDRIQKAPIYNHLAVGGHDWGRLGPDVALRVNSTDVEIEALEGAGWTSELLEEEPPKKKAPRRRNGPRRKNNKAPRDSRRRKGNSMILKYQNGAARIDGVEYELEGGMIRQARQALDAAAERARADAAEEERGAIDRLAEVSKDTLELAIENAKMRGELKAAREVNLDELVDSRTAVVEKARAIDPKIEVVGRSNSEIARAALDKAGIKVAEDATEDYVRGRLDALEVKTKKRNDEKVRKNAKGIEDEDEGDFDSALEAAERKRNEQIFNSAKRAREAARGES